ncbi:hypothetical protein, partial [Pseudomonas sp. URMO17WK12:I10]
TATATATATATRIEHFILADIMSCNVRAVIYQKKELSERVMPYNMHLINFGNCPIMHGVSALHRTPKPTNPAWERPRAAMGRAAALAISGAKLNA